MINNWDKIDPRFYSQCVVEKADIDNANEILRQYTEKRTDEYCVVKAMIDEGITKRQNDYDALYQTIDSLLQGSILDETAAKSFMIDTGNNEALAIMNSKAAIFDTRGINVELKPKAMKDVVNNEDNFIYQFGKVLNESYLANQKYHFVFADAIKYSRGYPMAVSLIGWDDNATLGEDTNVKGDITCENIPVSHFWWDPAATTMEGCEFVFIAKDLSYRKIADFIKSLKVGNIKLLNAAYLNKNLQTTNTQNGSELRGQQQLVSNGAVEMVCLYRLVGQGKDTKVKIYYVIDRQYVIGEQELNIPYLPFAILKEQSLPNSFTGISSVMLALPELKKLAFVDGVLNTLALTQKNPITLISNGSGVDGRTLVENITAQDPMVLEVNGDVNNVLRVVEPAPIDSSLLTWRQTVEQNINRMIASSDVANGLSFGSAISGGAVQNMVDQATVKENTSIVELEKYLVRFIRIMLALIRLNISKNAKIPKREEDANILTFRAQPTGSNNPDQYDFIKIQDIEFKQLEADINIDVELLRTSKKNKQQQDLMTLYQMELQYRKESASNVVLMEIVKNLNLPNKDAIITSLYEQTEQREVENTMQVLQTVQDLSELGVQDPMQAVQGALAAIKDPNIMAQIQQAKVQMQQLQEQQDALEQEKMLAVQEHLAQGGKI